MTDAIGPGARLRYVGYRGTTNNFHLTLGRIYTVDQVWALADMACACCHGHVGVTLRELANQPVPRRPSCFMVWCPCGFRPVGGDDAMLKQFTTEPTKVKEPA